MAREGSWDEMEIRGSIIAEETLASGEVQKTLAAHPLLSHLREPSSPGGRGVWCEKENG